MFLLMNSLVYADVIYLKSGDIIKGKIIEQGDEFIKIDSSSRGATITFYINDVDRIEKSEEQRLEPAAEKEQSIPMDVEGMLDEAEKRMNDPDVRPVKKILLSAAEYQLKGQKSEAERVFKQAIEDFSAEPDVYVQYIFFLITDNRFEEAYRYSQEAGRKFPENDAFKILENGLKKINTAETSEQRFNLMVELFQSLQYYIH